MINAGKLQTLCGNEGVLDFVLCSINSLSIDGHWHMCYKLTSPIFIIPSTETCIVKLHSGSVPSPYRPHCQYQYFQPQFLEDDIDNNTITFEFDFEFDDDMVDRSKIKRRDWSTYKRNWKLKCCNCIAIGFIVVMLYLFVQFINYDGPVSFDDDSLELNTK